MFSHICSRSSYEGLLFFAVRDSSGDQSQVNVLKQQKIRTYFFNLFRRYLHANGLAIYRHQESGEMRVRVNEIRNDISTRIVGNLDESLPVVIKGMCRAGKSTIAYAIAQEKYPGMPVFRMDFSAQDELHTPALTEDLIEKVLWNSVESFCQSLNKRSDITDLCRVAKEKGERPLDFLNDFWLQTIKKACLILDEVAAEFLVRLTLVSKDKVREVYSLNGGILKQVLPQFRACYGGNKLKGK